MQIEKLSDNWLFQSHSRRTIKEWLKQLRYFSFKRAWGGHANDGDEFRVAFTFTDRRDLITKVGQLGLTLNTIPDDFPRPVVGKSYPSEEYKKFKNEIKQFKDLEQPGLTMVFGRTVLVWITNNSIQITISGTRDGNHYEVTEDDLKVCMELEKIFDNLDWKKDIDKSLDESVCCISRTNYPEIFEDEISLPNNHKPHTNF